MSKSSALAASTSQQKAKPLREAQIEDFISGLPVHATPEETEAVQVFARRLVEDYGYPKNVIQTRPQHRVRKRPSDEAKSYPVDIAVFENHLKTDGGVRIIVECKKPTRKDGIEQLKLYLDMSAAEIGVWFNGNDHAYLRKLYHRDGRRSYAELPNIPRFGQRIEDIGKFLRSELRAPSNLKAVFRDIRNHLAGNATGITRDEAFAQEIISLLFCKIYDEINSAPDASVDFRCGVDEEPKFVTRRISALFDKVKREYPDVFTAKDTITLDATSVFYVVGELQGYCVTEADRDAIGEAFEVFIGPALRGSEGQFFTPRNVVRMLISMLSPGPGDVIIDPACGSGGFLITALEHVWRAIDREAKCKKWSAVQLEKRKRDIATRCFRGLDKDTFLAKATKAYMAIMGDGRGGVFCENALQVPSEWGAHTQAAIGLGDFDVVVTNPPFGSKIKITGTALLRQYSFGHKWNGGRETEDLRTDQAPHILFLERAIQFLRDGGKLGIVLPESVLGNPSYEYVVDYLLQRMTLKAVVAMPEPLFKTSGKGGTHTKVAVLVLEKRPPRGDPLVFMADAKWCGHDSRGNPTIRRDDDGHDIVLDEIPEIAERYREFLSGKTFDHDHLGFTLQVSQLSSSILVPKYYDPELDTYVKKLESSHDMVRLGDLVEHGALSLSTGVEVGKMAYGTGRIPFVRTSDLSNWEIKADFKHGVSAEIYEEYRDSCDVRAGDILLVRDGTYLIGTTAIVTVSDLPMLLQSHIYRIRVEDEKQIDPWLLFACLNAPVVRAQVRAKQFTQDIIDTLGRRIFELHLPVPRSAKKRNRIAREMQETIEQRVALRNRTAELALEIEGIGSKGGAHKMLETELDPMGA